MEKSQAECKEAYDQLSIFVENSNDLPLLCDYEKAFFYMEYIKLIVLDKDEKEMYLDNTLEKIREEANILQATKKYLDYKDLISLIHPDNRKQLIKRCREQLVKDYFIRKLK